MAYHLLKKREAAKTADWPEWNERDAKKDFAAAVHLESMLCKYQFKPHPILTICRCFYLEKDPSRVKDMLLAPAGVDTPLW